MQDSQRRGIGRGVKTALLYLSQIRQTAASVLTFESWHDSSWVWSFRRAGWKRGHAPTPSAWTAHTGGNSRHREDEDSVTKNNNNHGEWIFLTKKDTQAEIKHDAKRKWTHHKGQSQVGHPGEPHTGFNHTLDLCEYCRTWIRKVDADVTQMWCRVSGPTYRTH